MYSNTHHDFTLQATFKLSKNAEKHIAMLPKTIYSSGLKYAAQRRLHSLLELILAAACAKFIQRLCSKSSCFSTIYQTRYLTFCFFDYKQNFLQHFFQFPSIDI